MSPAIAAPFELHNEKDPKEHSFEGALEVSAFLLAFFSAVNKIPLPIRGGGASQVETARALRRWSSTRAILAHGLIVSGTSL
jgi:hypothetical protein